MWKIAFAKGKRLINFKLTVNKFMCPDFTISNPKWVCFSVYKILKHNDLHCFFKELIKALSKTIEFYKNLFPSLESDKVR